MLLSSLLFQTSLHLDCKRYLTLKKYKLIWIYDKFYGDFAIFVNLPNFFVNFIEIAYIYLYDSFC